MINQSLLNEITVKAPDIGAALKKINYHSLLDPEMAVTRTRKTLELIVNQIEPVNGDGLYERIQVLSDILPDSIITYMHFIRKLGNTAVHSEEKVSIQIAKDAKSALTNIICWHLNIDPNKKLKMKARYFIADAVFRTWSKIVVLTDDGVLYSEYLAYMNLTKFRKTDVDFYDFKDTDYSFGEREHGNAYQSIREVTYQEAASFQLSSQQNWVNRYLLEVGVETP